jgi:hypothetical protein
MRSESEWERNSWLKRSVRSEEDMVDCLSDCPRTSIMKFHGLVGHVHMKMNERDHLSLPRARKKEIPAKPAGGEYAILSELRSNIKFSS